MTFLSNLTEVQMAIILMAVCLLIGILLGILAGSLFQGRRKETQIPAEIADDGDSPHREVLRLLRDNSSGKLVVQIQGRNINDVAALSAELKLGLMRTAREWNAWLGMTPPEAQARPPGEPPQRAASATPAALTPSLTPPAAPDTPQPLTPVLPSLPVEPARTPLPPKPTSIVGEIDAILQAHLEKNPIPGLTIRLSEDPREGVIVWVNLQKFHGIESVTEPQARALLKAAVEEWEKGASFS